MKKTFLSILLMVACVAAFGATPKKSAKAKDAKYVIYFICDGMGMNQVNGAEMYLAELEGRIGITPLNFTLFPSFGYATTFSATNGVTDSAASGTALATGKKTKNSRLGVNVDASEPLYSVAKEAKASGKSVGIATTVSVDHATPGAFYATQPDRNMYYEIALQIPESQFDFFGGSGFLQPRKRGVEKSIYDVFAESGYTVAYGYDEAKAMVDAKTDNLIVVSKKGKAQDALPMAIDRAEDDLRMDQITDLAIESLKDDKDGFFLMVECGMIDWAGHSNDASTCFKEVIDFQRSVDVALKFYEEHPDETLIVITADHETGGLGLGAGPYELQLKHLEHQKCSKNELTARIAQYTEGKAKEEITWDYIKPFISEQVGLFTKVPVPPYYEQELIRTFERSFGPNVENVKSMYSAANPLASNAIDILNRIALVSWGSGGHSAAYVPVYAIGANCQLFEGKTDNAEIPGKLAQAMGVEF
ncbi:MAG: alkaline phosphatase [Marinifilaceae bacterium]|nr:alkaline phosphatase [Marinifilaceae bacterium]